MNELTTIRKILERLTKYITKKKGYICQYCGHRSLQPYGGKCAQSKSGHHHYIAAEHWERITFKTKVLTRKNYVY